MQRLVQRVFWGVAVMLAVACLSSTVAHAAPNNTSWLPEALGTGHLTDDVLQAFKAKVSQWGEGLELAAARLFWIMATISLAWTFGTMALRRADVGEYFTEFVRFTFFTGLFYWLLDNGPEHAELISQSMRQLAAEASGDSLQHELASPSGLLSMGFEVVQAVFVNTQWTDPVQVMAAIPLLLLAIAVLVILTLICANMLALLIAGWFLAYGGIFFLGFGGARWTSDMAVNYYKSVLSLAVQAFGMILVAGVGEGILRDAIGRISGNLQLWDLVILLVVVLMMDSLIKRVPPMLGSIAGGSAGGQWGRPRGVRDSLQEILAKARFTQSSSVAPVTVLRNLRKK